MGEIELRAAVNQILGLHPEYDGRLSSGVSRTCRPESYEVAIGRMLIRYLNRIKSSPDKPSPKPETSPLDQ